MPISRFLPVSRRGALCLGATGGALAVTTPQALAASSAKAELLNNWADGWSTLGDPLKLLALVTPSVVYEDVAAGDLVRGLEAFRGLLADATRAIPNFRVELFDGLVTESMAAAEYAIAGTQTGDLPYLKATGKPFRLRAASIFKLQNGLIERESRYYNMAHFLTQLGALAAADLPPFGAPAGRPGG
jgi:steroid delta-isomerase-like uncharacterized protein